MPLPENPRMKWPPEEWKKVFDVYAEHDAWYSGDPNRIAEVHSARIYTPTPRGRFWASSVHEERRVMLHVPIAGDIASMSADLLFAEAPKFRIPEAHGMRASSDAKAAQERLDQIINDSNMVDRLLEAAEVCAALGGVFIKPSWDKELADHPMLSVAHVDNAIPEFRFGMLTAVTFWTVIEEDDGVVWRLLERHERGRILYGLYKGDRDTLGMRVSLDTHSVTAGRPDVIETQYPGLLVRYVPNMLPNRRFRGWPIGRSDYDGCEGLMDALDEVFTSWMRDIRLARARIIVPEEWLSKDEFGNLRFDIDQEVFTVLDIDPVTTSNNFNLTTSQFAIRTEEHQKAALELIDRIITNAGYSPQSFGLRIEGRAESGTALNIRERRSYITKSKKERYWKGPIQDVLEMMLIIDNLHLNNGTPMGFKPVVEFQDASTHDMSQLAETVELLARAQAVSIDTKVRMLHPDWSEEQIQQEVRRIMQETGVLLPEPDGASSYEVQTEGEDTEQEDQPQDIDEAIREQISEVGVE